MATKTSPGPTTIQAACRSSWATAPAISAARYSWVLLPNSVAVGDFNGDGIQDLAVGSCCSGVSILLGDGDGNFSHRTNVAGHGFGFITVGDFNGDGNQDLALAASGDANPYVNGVAILLGDGTGNFAPRDTSFLLS